MLSYLSDASTSDPGIVLVHGAWHGAWCWSEVIEVLVPLGASAICAPELPFDSLEADSVAVQEAVALVTSATGRPPLVCVHSYGGAAVADALSPCPAARLVYLAAGVPCAGESFEAACSAVEADSVGPEPSVQSVDDVSQSRDRSDDSSPAGGLWSPPRAEVASALFYNDCPPAVAARALALLRPIPRLSFRSPVGAAPWRVTPSSYLLCEDDRALSPRLQEGFARRLGGELIRLRTGHSPFLSQPAGLARLLVGLAARDGGASGAIRGEHIPPSSEESPSGDRPRGART